MLLKLGLCFVVGLIVGAITFYLVQQIRCTKGTFKVNDSNPEKDLFHLDIFNLDDVYRKKLVILKVIKDSKVRQNNKVYSERSE